MIKFVTFNNVDPAITPIVQEFVWNTGRSKPVSKPTQEPVQEEVNPVLEESVEVEPVISPTTKRPSVDNTRLVATDIEDIFRQAGLLTINGKQIKFGNKALRDQNASFGAKNSNHKKRDPHTGNAMARDISIVGGNLDDYTEFRKQIMANELISKYLDAKGWGIINEVTPQILARTRGTGMHFHFGPDSWARRTWSGWRSNPNVPITQAFKQGGKVRRFQNSGKIKQKKSIWEILDDYANDWEGKVAIASLATTGVTLVPGGQWMAPVAGATNVAGGLIDLYQGTRAALRGDWNNVAKNAFELGLSLIGAKAARSLTKSASLAGKSKQFVLGKNPEVLGVAVSPNNVHKASKWIMGTSTGIGSTSSLIELPNQDEDYVDGYTYATPIVYNKLGGRFTFKKSQMVKDAERLNGKRDMRKKLVKSDVVTNKKKRIQKGQEGLKFATYTPVETPAYEPVDPFSDYNFPSTYKEYITAEPIQQTIEQVSEQPKEQTDPQEEAPKQQPQRATRIVSHIYKDRDKWVSDLREAYRKAGITNENALKMLIAQDALESGWGKSAQGKFNYGNLTAGKSWKGETVNGKDSDSKGNPIRQRFRSYSSIEEYAADKVQFLKTLYDFDENDNINTFSHKLQGGNKGSRKYAASPRYVQSIINTYNNLK